MIALVDRSVGAAYKLSEVQVSADCNDDLFVVNRDGKGDFGSVAEGRRFLN